MSNLKQFRFGEVVGKLIKKEIKEYNNKEGTFLKLTVLSDGNFISMSNFSPKSDPTKHINLAKSLKENDIVKATCSINTNIYTNTDGVTNERNQMIANKVELTQQGEKAIFNVAGIITQMVEKGNKKILTLTVEESYEKDGQIIHNEPKIIKLSCNKEVQEVLDMEDAEIGSYIHCAGYIIDKNEVDEFGVSVGERISEFQVKKVYKIEEVEESMHEVDYEDIPF